MSLFSSPRRPPFCPFAGVRIDAFDHHHKVGPVGLDFRLSLPFRHGGKVDVATLQFEVVDDQPATLHMKDLHRRARLVDEDERVTVLHVAPHLIADDTAERIEALSHVGGMRVQVEAVAVTQAEHPLPGQHDQAADGLHRDAPAQAHRDSVGEADLADRLLDGAPALGWMVLVHKDHLATAVVDAHRHELAGLSGRYLLTELGLPVIKTALRKACLPAELTDGCATVQELLVYRSEVIEGPHKLCLFCGQSYRGSVRRQGRGLPNAYDPFLCAYAMSHLGFSVVTYEKSNQFGKKDVKLPDICQMEGVTCIPVIPMLLDLGIEFK